MSDEHNEQPPASFEIPKEGSLGLLALGYRGLVAWRAVRGRDWIAERKKEHDELTEQMSAKKAEAEAAGTEQAESKKGPAVQKRLPPEELKDLSITIVTGLPRSGTSMMMQMLSAGGMAPYTDGVRGADVSNPRGYFEHAKVKGLASDSTWLPDADGLVAKVVAPLLHYLPQGPAYHVVFMERDIEEILNSQSAMLDRDGRSSADKDVLRRAYERQVAQAKSWIRRTRSPMIGIAHQSALSDPLSVAKELNSFFGGALPESEMAAVVDPSLHRERT